MSEPFDPYREWLGIKGGRRSANYYRLFELKPFEDDLARITAQADATIRRVEQIQPATHPELHARLLQKLATAKRCLCDPRTRAQYNAGLRHALAARELHAAAPMPLAIPVRIVTPHATDGPASNTARGDVPAASDDAAALWQTLNDSAGGRRRRRSRTGPNGPLIALGTGLACVIAILLGFIVWQQPASEPAETAAAAPGPQADTPAAEAERPRPRREFRFARPVVAAQAQEGTSDPPSSLAAGASPSSANADKPSAPPAAASPKSSALFMRAVRRARLALAARDLTGAQRHLSDAAKCASSPAETQQLDSWRALAARVAQFHDAVGAGLGKLEPAEELTWDKDRVLVIESGPKMLAVRAEGSRREFTLATLPTSLALSVAERGTNQNTPAAKVSRGAFLLVEPGANAAAVRALWESAATEGEPVDSLLPLVDLATQPISREQAPQGDALSSARQSIDTRFATELAAATTGEQKTALALKLIVAAAGIDSSAEQYAALSAARDLASAAANGPTALAAIDELGLWFDVDALVLKSDALAAALAAGPAPPQARQIAAMALALGEQTATAQRSNLTHSLADTAISAARAARDPALFKRARELRQQSDRSPTKSSKPAPGE